MKLMGYRFRIGLILCLMFIIPIGYAIINIVFFHLVIPTLIDNISRIYLGFMGNLKHFTSLLNNPQYSNFLKGSDTIVGYYSGYIGNMILAIVVSIAFLYIASIYDKDKPTVVQDVMIGFRHMDYTQFQQIYNELEAPGKERLTLFEFHIVIMMTLLCLSAFWLPGDFNSGINALGTNAGNTINKGVNLGTSFSVKEANKLGNIVQNTMTITTNILKNPMGYNASNIKPFDKNTNNKVFLPFASTYNKTGNPEQGSGSGKSLKYIDIKNLKWGIIFNVLFNILIYAIQAAFFTLIAVLYYWTKILSWFYARSHYLPVKYEPKFINILGKRYNVRNCVFILYMVFIGLTIVSIPVYFINNYLLGVFGFLKIPPLFFWILAIITGRVANGFATYWRVQYMDMAKQEQSEKGRYYDPESGKWREVRSDNQPGPKTKKKFGLFFSGKNKPVDTNVAVPDENKETFEKDINKVEEGNQAE